MDMIAQECVSTLQAGVPLLGVCWYPIIDRPDWDYLDNWHQSGIWERATTDNDEYERKIHEPTAAAFLRAQTLVANQLPQTPGNPKHSEMIET